MVAPDEKSPPDFFSQCPFRLDVDGQKEVSNQNMAKLQAADEQFQTRFRSGIKLVIKNSRSL
jgi:hypothetical protein